jgi:Domain of unknown function (DUF4201)
MGEVLLEVDFSQLKIENQQYIEKIDERNQDLLRLKMMSGNTLQILNSYKKKLNTLTMESARIKADIESRQELLGRIDGETKVVEEVIEKAEQLVVLFKLLCQSLIRTFHCALSVREKLTQNVKIFLLKEASAYAEKSLQDSNALRGAGCN